MLIKGETVTLIEKTFVSYDDFGQPVYSKTETLINDVIVGSPSSDDVIAELNISGKRIAYTLGIPKDDTHEWTDTDVIVRGIKCRTIGIPIAYTLGNMPNWFGINKQIKVEAYE